MSGLCPAVVVVPGECLHCPGQRVLQSLHALLYHYLPALFVIGHDVRRLTWEGGVGGGSVKGDVAKRVLEYCLALQWGTGTPARSTAAPCPSPCWPGSRT